MIVQPEISGWATPTSLSFNDSHQPGNSRSSNMMRDVALSIEQGEHIPLLAVGVPQRVGKLKGYGNAIVVPLAAEVIKAWMLGRL